MYRIFDFAQIRIKKKAAAGRSLSDCANCVSCEGWVNRLAGWLASGTGTKRNQGLFVSSSGGVLWLRTSSWVFHMLLTKQCALRLREPMRHVMIDDGEKGERTRLLF